MCCDKRYIYTSDLYYETPYTEWDSSANPIDTTALASGDFIHDGFIPISCAVADVGGLGEIVGLKLAEHESGTMQKKDLRIWIFNGTSGSIAKNTARAWSQTQAQLIAGYIDVVTADYTDMGTTDSVVFKDLRNGTALGGHVVSLNPSTQTCYIVIEARAAVTFDNASAIRVRLKFRRT